MTMETPQEMIETLEETTEDLSESLYLPWSHFLHKEAPTENALKMIESWRRSEWDVIARDLQTIYWWNIPEGIEPHWVSPGKAVYWQEQTILGRQFVDDITGAVIPYTADAIDKGHWERTYESSGWETTGPLPANNASQLAHYLNKGFRLRPPVDGVDAETMRESADLPEAPSEDVSSVQYYCLRHPDKGKLGFINWKTYIRHCAQYQEKPIGDPPQEILDFAGMFKWYCPLHNVGYNKSKEAQRHYKSERKKPGGQYHPTIEDMLVKKEGAIA
jgi:hypothetical protein